MVPRSSLAKLSYLLLGATLLFAASASATDARMTVLYRFSGGQDGANPMGPLVSDEAGNLYGVTPYGGHRGFGFGVIFELSPPAANGARWTETVLHTFSGHAGGAYPFPGLTFDRAGNLYGTTFGGGNCVSACGVAFQLSPPRRGGHWSYSVLHTFTGPGLGDGGGPLGNLVLDGVGNLYGTTNYGGGVVCTDIPGPCGTVFRLAPPASKGGVWTETVLYSFRGVPDGQFPQTGVVLDSSGDLFGTTAEGGTGRCNDGEGTTIGCGTAFELTPSPSGGWTETIVHDYNRIQDGPLGFLLLDPPGALFGNANYELYKLSPPKSPSGEWTDRVLHRFPEGIAGTISASELTTDGRGNLFGTTVSSGLDGFGTVYELSPPTTEGGAWTETTLQSFYGGFNSNQPYGGVIFGKDGALYGAAQDNGSRSGGFVFKLTP